MAISLHATNDELRNDIVPINKKFPLKELIKACREYPRSKNSKRITFEYVMLKGVNDTAQDARKLVKLISGIPAKINLILLILGLIHLTNALVRKKSRNLVT